MKRFDFDWENNRALKFDDCVRFPLVLDMEPYTVDGVNRRETSNQQENSVTASKQGHSGQERTNEKVTSDAVNKGKKSDQD